MSERPRYFRCGDDFPDCEFARTGECIRVEPGDSFICPYRRPRCPERTIELTWWQVNGGRVALAAIVALALVLGTLWLFPGSRKAPSTQTEVAKSLPIATPAAALAPPTAVAPPPPVEEPARVLLRLQAPETLAADLLPALVEAFLRKSGHAGVETRADTGAKMRLVRGRRPGAATDEAIEIRSSREQDAFGRLAKGECDFVVALRGPTAEEMERLVGILDPASPACVRVLALDAPAVIVSKANPIASLSIPQLESVWKADAIDWSQFGAPAGAIQLHLLAEGQPAIQVLPEALRKHLATRGRVRRHASPDSLANAVAGDPSSIGIVPMRHSGEARPVPLQPADGMQPLLPTPFTVATEDYPFSSRILIFNATRHSANVSEFLRFVVSSEGQDVVGQLGYVDQNLRPRTEPLPELYRAAEGFPGWLHDRLAGAERLSANFRFETGSDILDVKAKADTARLVQRLAEPNLRRKQLLLAGFADSRGGDEINVPLSRNRALAVAQELEKYGVQPAATIGLGAQLPVAPNTDESGWEKNRRVEIWLLEVRPEPAP